MYEILHDKMIEYKADIVNCGYYFEYKNHREKHAIEKDCVYEGDSLIEQSYSSRYVCYAVWFKLYRKTLFDLVRFPEGKNSSRTFFGFVSVPDGQGSADDFRGLSF